MRNVFFIGLIVFIAVATCGYGISWYAQANATKDAIEYFIAQANGNQKYLTYDAIEATGFPARVNVSIVRPRFHGRMDQFMKQLNPNSQDMPEWDLDLLLNGRITFGINAVSDSYSMVISGPFQETSTIEGKTSKHVSQPLSDMSCQLNFARSTGMFDTLWDFSQLSRDSKTLVRDFRAVDCNMMGQTTTDETTKAMLSSAGLSRLYITSTPQSPSHQLRFYLKITDMEVSKAGDEWMSTYLRAIAPKGTVPYTMSTYGKQNIDIDFTYLGPIDFGDAPSQEAKGNVPMDILLSKFDIRNSAYNYNMAFRFNNTPKSTDRSTTVYLKSESQFNEQYDVLLHDFAKGFIQQLYTSHDPKMMELHSMVEKYTPEQLYAIVQPSVPKLSTLGKTVVAIDGSYDGTEAFTAGAYKLNAFEITLAPYAITGKGDIKVATDAMPSGNLYISCSKCLSIIDDLNDYGSRLQRTVNYFDPEKAAAIATNMQQADAFKRFLAVLASSGKDANGNPIQVFNIVSANNNTTINGKDMNQVTVLYNEYVRSVTKQPTNLNGAKPR